MNYNMTPQNVQQMQDAKRRMTLEVAQDAAIESAMLNMEKSKFDNSMLKIQDGVSDYNLIEGWNYDYTERVNSVVNKNHEEKVRAQGTCGKMTLERDDGSDKKWTEAQEHQKAAVERTVALQQMRMTYFATGNMTAQHYREETLALEERLKAIDLYEKASEKEMKGQGTYTDVNKLILQLESQRDRMNALRRYAELLPLGSKNREKALEKAEDATDKYYSISEEYKLSGMKEEEKKKRVSSNRWHRFYDASKSLHVLKDKPLSKVDTNMRAIFTDNNGNQVTHILHNTGRCHMGGTKPMFEFEDTEEIMQGQQKKDRPKYLFKEAINCMGFDTPERAYVTEAGSKLQEIICGKDNFVKARIVVDQKGKLIGTVQEYLKSMKKGEEGYINLFDWQKNGGKTDLPEEVKKQVLVEHTLDWLLCNFDTKGENFLQKPDGKLVSLDKEASFSKINDEKSTHMSMDYKPHKNDTIYNTFFQKYFYNREFDLDFDSIEKQILEAERIPTPVYKKMFEDYVNARYSKQSDRDELMDKILERKKNLRKEYKHFLGELFRHRFHPESADVKDRIDENGDYLFPTERLNRDRIKATAISAKDRGSLPPAATPTDGE